MEFPFEAKLLSETDTIVAAKNFSSYLTPGDVVLLNGNLGAGKTFFVKYVCREYAIENVSSPSFAIVNEYINSNKIYHFDFYRIQKETELYDIGIEEYLGDKEAIVFIEWAQLWEEILHRKSYIVNIELNGIDERIIRIIKCQN